jgi:DNA-binding ferritin-like protein
MKKRLTEAVYSSELKMGRRIATKLLQGAMKVYDGSEYRYGDLAVWLGFLRALGMIHHSHHWQTTGSPFYGDHKLLEQLYSSVQGEVDTVGEKVVGLDSPILTNYFMQMKHMLSFMQGVSDSSKPPMVVSLQAELVFIACGEMITDRLESEDLLTSGVANMLGDILDRHESHVYLLQQRLAFIS